MTIVTTAPIAAASRGQPTCKPSRSVVEPTGVASTGEKRISGTVSHAMWIGDGRLPVIVRSFTR